MLFIYVALAVVEMSLVGSYAETDPPKIDPSVSTIFVTVSYRYADSSCEILAILFF